MSSHLDEPRPGVADPPGSDGRPGPVELHDAGHRLDTATRLADVARSFFTPNSVEQTLQTITATATAMIVGAAAADVLIISHKMFRSHAKIGDVLLRAGVSQEMFGESPCADAARGETVVVSNDLSTDLRWPRFSMAAADAGIRSALSLALYVGDTVLGALNLFGTAVDAFTDYDVTLAGLLATHASIALYAATDQQQFTAAVASRDVLGQAKGMLMERYDIDDAQAFDLLAKLSQDHQTPVTTVARELIVLGSETRTR